MNGENSPDDVQSEAGFESGFLNPDLKVEKKKILLENNPPIEWRRLKTHVTLVPETHNTLLTTTSVWLQIMFHL